MKALTRSTLLAVPLAYWFRFHIFPHYIPGGEAPDPQRYAVATPIVALTLVAVFAFMDVYRWRRGVEFINELFSVVRAMLVSRGDRMPDCGNGAFETVMVFTAEFADSATFRAAVPCAEMPRPMYSPAAGNAPVLELNALYRLELSPVTDERSAKNDQLWRADRIDVAHDEVYK